MSDQVAVYKMNFLPLSKKSWPWEINEESPTPGTIQMLNIVVSAEPR
jgi:hypothetical protein